MKYQITAVTEEGNPLSESDTITGVEMKKVLSSWSRLFQMEHVDTDGMVWDKNGHFIVKPIFD